MLERFLALVAATIFILHFVHCSALETGLCRQSYCKTSEQCDQTRLLECVGSPSKCDCRTGAGMIWVEEERSCMLMEDWLCYGRRGKEAKCVPNSSCVAGRCECDDDYLRDGFGRCELSYGNVCSEEKPCARRFGLECFNETGNALKITQDQMEGEVPPTCRCMGEGISYEWDIERRKCVSKPGVFCDLEGDAGYGKDDQLECVQHSHCVEENMEGVCRCKPGFTQTGEGSCLLDFGQKCDDSAGYRCNTNQFLVCQEGRCACQFYGMMQYDEEARQCKILVGEGCQVGGGGDNSSVDNAPFEKPPACVKDAYCKPHHLGSGYSGSCVCREEFEVSREKTCTRYKRHGMPCAAAMDCDRSQFMECNFNQEMNGRCECFRNHMQFDGDQCRVYPGKMCEENPNCVANAYCEGKWCVCKEGYKIDLSGGCVKESKHEPILMSHPDKSYSSPNFDLITNHQVSPINCDHLHERTPEWKKCLELKKCDLNPGTHIWMGNETSCLALVGTKCGMNYECVPHAVCDRRENICQCAPPALTTNSLTCLPAQMPEKELHPHPHHLNDNDKSNKDCPEMHTLKSVRLAGVPYVSSGNRVFAASSKNGTQVTTIMVMGLLMSVIISQYC